MRLHVASLRKHSSFSIFSVLQSIEKTLHDACEAQWQSKGMEHSTAEQFAEEPAEEFAEEVAEELAGDASSRRR